MADAITQEVKSARAESRVPKPWPAAMSVVNNSMGRRLDPIHGTDWCGPTSFAGSPRTIHSPLEGCCYQHDHGKPSWGSNLPCAVDWKILLCSVQGCSAARPPAGPHCRAYQGPRWCEDVRPKACPDHSGVAEALVATIGMIFFEHTGAHCCKYIDRYCPDSWGTDTRRRCYWRWENRYASKYDGTLNQIRRRYPQFKIGAYRSQGAGVFRDHVLDSFR